MSKDITYIEFIHKVSVLHERMKGSWRLGQTYYNILSNCKPSIAESIKGTIHDPFNKNEISKELENIVKLNW